LAWSFPAFCSYSWVFWVRIGSPPAAAAARRPRPRRGCSARGLRRGPARRPCAAHGPIGPASREPGSCGTGLWVRDDDDREELCALSDSCCVPGRPLPGAGQPGGRSDPSPARKHDHPGENPANLTQRPKGVNPNSPTIWIGWHHQYRRRNAGTAAPRPRAAASISPPSRSAACGPRGGDDRGRGPSGRAGHRRRQQACAFGVGPGVEAHCAPSRSAFDSASLLRRARRRARASRTRAAMATRARRRPASARRAGRDLDLQVDAVEQRPRDRPR
jgi:hypothetical protein